MSRSCALTPLCIAATLALAPFAAQAAAPAATTRVIVGFDTATEAAAARGALAGLGAQLKVDLPHIAAMAVELPASALARLQRLPGVSYVEEDAKRYPIALLPRAAAPVGAQGLPSMGKKETIPYGITMVQAKEVPASSAPQIMVCIIDSGLDRTHPDLAPNTITGDSDPGGAGPWFQDGSHHGTHVAGTIAAVNNGTGLVGVNARGEVALHIVRVFGDDGGWAYSSTLNAATQKCKAAGAKVINMSLGGLVPSKSERKNFGQLEKDGLISVAAAGNDGIRLMSYPAGYPSVISVAAANESGEWASFSTYNTQVDLTAPGDLVLSTVPMGAGLGSMVRQQQGVGLTNSAAMAGSAQTPTPVKERMYDMGLGQAVNAKAAGKVCLIQRGDTTFAEKAQVCMDSGGVGAIIYNNEPGDFMGTLGTLAATIPVVSVSDTNGAKLLASMRLPVTLRVEATNWDYFSGTSMAAPHVTGVVAKLWRLQPQCSNVEIRRSLAKSALDMGAPGPDDKTGHGMVQLRAAYDRIEAKGCGN